MKVILSVATLAALMGSVGAFAQVPPPPPPPGAEVMRMEGPQMERREMRRIIIRGDEQGPHSAMALRGMRPHGLMGAYGLDPRMIERMADALELSPQQRGKVTELVATARPEMRKTMRDMAAESRRLNNLNAGDAKYVADSTAIARKMGELTTSLVQQGADLRSKVWQVLTPEQRKKAETLRERMRERGKDRMRHGGGKPHALILEESDEIG